MSATGGASRLFSRDATSPASSLVAGSHATSLASDSLRYKGTTISMKNPLDLLQKGEIDRKNQAYFPPDSFADFSLEEEPLDFSSTESFEGLVGDLRRTFIGWLKKVELDVRREKDSNDKSLKSLNEERLKIWQQFQTEHLVQLERIQDERNKLEADLASQQKAVNAERQECRQKMNDAKAKAEQEMETQKRQLMLEGEKLRQECETFDLECRRIVDSSLAAETTINMNVGGVYFETSRHTLNQQPGSFLEGLLSGRHSVTRDESGRMFLDRDPELFRMILNFLRNPKSPPLPRDVGESEWLAQEAEYYGIKFFPFPLVFACGGHNGHQHLNSMEVLDIGQQCWRACRPMETERTYFGGGTLRQRFLIFGGQNVDYKALCDTEVYDTLRDCWTRGPSLNASRRNLTSCAFENRVYAIGGFDGSTLLSSVECYDPRMNNWALLAPLKSPRSSAMVSQHGGRLVIFGGTTGERVRSVESYDIRMNKWERVVHSQLVDIRSSGSGVSLFEHTYAIGGIDNTHTIHDSIECLAPDGWKWKVVKEMPAPLFDCAAVSLVDSICISGGQEVDVSSKTDFFRPETDEWLPGPKMLYPRYGHTLLDRLLLGRHPFLAHISELNFFMAIQSPILREMESWFLPMLRYSNQHVTLVFNTIDTPPEIVKVIQKSKKTSLQDVIDVTSSHTAHRLMHEIISINQRRAQGQG